MSDHYSAKSGRTSRGERHRSRYSRLSLAKTLRLRLGCLGLLLASGVGLWAAGDRFVADLPRRAIAAVLSERLAARVRVDRVEILSSDRLLLAGLSMTEFRDYPFIDVLRVEELVVEGSLRGVVDNRFDRLRFRGASARLAPAPAVEPPDRPLPAIGELILEPASIRLAAGPGRDDLLICLEAGINDVGGKAEDSAAAAFGAGEVRMSAAELDLEPLYALASATPPELEADVTELALELTFDAAGERLTASASRARVGERLELEQPRFSAERFGGVTVMRLDGGRALAKLDGRLATFDQPSARAAITAAADGTLHFELVPRLAGLDDGRLEADWDPTLERVRSFEARFQGLDLGGLVPLTGLEATAGAELRAAGDRLDYRLEIVTADRATIGDLELTGIDGSRLRVTGSLPFAPLAELRAPVWDGPLRALIEIPAGRGRWRTLTLPPAVFPLAARFTGHWLGDACCAGARVPRAHSFSGSYRLDSTAAGRLAADGEIGVEGDEVSAGLTWAWTGVELARLVRLLRDSGLPIPAFELAGEGTAKGSFRQPRGSRAPAIQGTLHLRRLEAAGETRAGMLRWSAGKSTAGWRWAGGRAPIELLALEASGNLTAPGLEALDLELQASGRFDPDLAQGQLESTVRESPSTAGGLGLAHVTGGWRRRTNEVTDASANLSLEDFDLARWQRLARPLAEAEALAGYRPSGLAGADLEATLTGDAWHFVGPAWLEAAGFASLDGSRVTEGLDSRFDLDLRGAAASPIEAQARGRAGGFLLLWNTFFGDFSDVEASLAARARVETASQANTPGQQGPRPSSKAYRDGPRQWHLEVDSVLPGGPSVEATIADSGDGRRYALSLEVADLAATHQRYLAPLLEEALGQLELGGELAVRVRGSAGPAWSVIGDLKVRDLQVTSGGGQAAVAGLDLDLPLDLRRSPGTELALSGPRLKGRLAFERLGVRGLELPPTESDLAVEADSVGLEKPVALSVLGGSVTLERLTLRQLLRPSRHLESGIELAGIRLERLSEELELIPLEGALNGRLAGVRLSPSTLVVDGGGEIEAFGGTVAVRDISGQDVLSRFPKLRLSADFRDVDLGALTRRIDFGEMTGILQGTIQDLELFRGVPVRFSARLDTVHRKGVPRTVDVKAVNNITILGTGQRAGVLDRGIQKFFNRYTYQRLGVSLRLERDVLLLRGLEHRDGKELFLRGRLPFRIDVVNAQPGKTVSYQTMVGRLKSLDFASATTEP